MKKRLPNHRERIYIMKATAHDRAGRENGKPYRILTIPEKFSLHELAEAVLDSFHFDFDHTFGLYGNLEEYRDSEEGYELFYDIGEATRFSGVKRTMVNKVFREIGKKMLLVYDYNNEWKFIVKLRDIEFPSFQEKHPKVIESTGSAPVQYDFPKDKFSHPYGEDDENDNVDGD